MMNNNEITKAVILVGGWGTRLRPLTYTIPKPLIPFCNKPMLKYQIEKLVCAGVKVVILAVNYLSELIVADCREYEKEFGIKIIYSKEDTPLGTGGALALARQYIGTDSFFLLNSDICCNVDFNEMRRKFCESNCVGTILTYTVDDPTRYGLIKVRGDRIESFVEKPKVKEGNGPWIINAGMYILGQEVFDYIELRELSIEKEVFPILAQKGLLTEFPLSGYWMDIGQAKDYLLGQRMNLQSIESECIFPAGWQDDEGAPFTSPYLCAKNNVVIGSGVKLGKNIKLKDCTIFDGVCIGDNTEVKNSIIGWDSVIGENCHLEDATVLGKSACIEDNLVLRATKVLPSVLVSSSNISIK